MKSMLKDIKNIMWLFKPYWNYEKGFVLITLIFWGLLLPLDRILVVYFPAAIMNALKDEGPFIRIIIIAAVFESVLMVIPIFEDIYNMCICDKIQTKIDLNIKREVYLQALKTDYNYIDNPEYYDNYTWAINEYANKAQNAFSLIYNFISSIVVISALIAIISTARPLVIIITIISIILRTYSFFQINKLDIEKEDEFIPRDRKLAYLHRIFYMRQYAPDLKSTNLKQFVFKKFDSLRDEKVGIVKKYSWKTVKWAILADIIYRLAEFIIVIDIAYSIYSGDILSVGLYVTLMLAVEQLNDYLYSLFELIRSGNKLSLYAERIRNFFEMESIIEIEKNNKNKDELLDKRPFSVSFNGVNFMYNSSKFTVSDLNLDIKSGEKVAIVGENGAGKTTFVKLLLRLYDVSSGNIYINDKEIREYNIYNLRRSVGVAFQTPNIYALTFKENIELYNDVSEEKFNDIINDFGLNSVLLKNSAHSSSEMTKEFEEKGIVLSGGEEQKIGLARLMTDNFGLIILDEPSSALDPLAEYEMNKLIMGSKNRSTTIVIAHRLSTVRDADRIILFDGGTIKEIGTHNELMALNGKYFKMFTKQAENYVR